MNAHREGFQVRPEGTKELLLRFGLSLLRVRYRYDEDRREYVKAVELVVQHRLRDSDAACLGSRASGARWNGTRPGGAQDPAGGIAEWRLGEGPAAEGEVCRRPIGLVRRVWMVRHDVAERLDLMLRVVGGVASWGTQDACEVNGRGHWFLDVGTSTWM